MSKPPYLRLRDGFSNMAPKPKAAIKYLNWISWKLIMLIFQMLLSGKSRGDYGDGSRESREGPTVRRWGPAQHPQKSKAQWCVSVVSALGIHEGDEPWDSLPRQLSKWVWAQRSARGSVLKIQVEKQLRKKLVVDICPPHVPTWKRASNYTRITHLHAHAHTVNINKQIKY